MTVYPSTRQSSIANTLGSTNNWVEMRNHKSSSKTAIMGTVLVPTDHIPQPTFCRVKSFAHIQYLALWVSPSLLVRQTSP